MGSLPARGAWVKEETANDAQWDELVFGMKQSVGERKHELLVIIDNEACIRFMPERMARWFGLSSEEIIGLNYRELFARQFPGVVSHLLKTLDSEVIYEGVLEELAVEGRQMFFEESTAVLRDFNGQKVGALLFSRDVTRHIVMLNNLRQREKVRLIDGLVASMAHHIKNPLTAIGGFLQLIRFTDSEEQIEEYCDIALQELERVNEAVDHTAKLVGLSRFISRPVEVAALVEAARFMIDTRAAGSGVEVQIIKGQPDVYVEGDFELLREAIFYLAQNGIDDMPGGGTLSLTWDYYPEKGRVAIMVVDEGTGIATHDPVMIGFFSSNQERWTLNSTIAEHIIIMHNGELNIANNWKEQGNTASINLPAFVKMDDQDVGAGKSINQ